MAHFIDTFHITFEFERKFFCAVMWHRYIFLHMPRQRVMCKHITWLKLGWEQKDFLSKLNWDWKNTVVRMVSELMVLYWLVSARKTSLKIAANPDNKEHGAQLGPTGPRWAHFGPMNLLSGKISLTLAHSGCYIVSACAIHLFQLCKRYLLPVPEVDDGDLWEKSIVNPCKKTYSKWSSTLF